MHDRLMQCFEAVFPGLAPGAITAASLDTMERWDSVASVALIAVIEEEFLMSIPVEEYEELTSFQKIHSYLLGKSS